MYVWTTSGLGNQLKLARGSRADFQEVASGGDETGMDRADGGVVVGVTDIGDTAAALCDGGRALIVLSRKVRWYPGTKRISISAPLYTAKTALYSPFLRFCGMHKEPR